MDEAIVNGMPESLRRYITDECMIPAVAFSRVPVDQLPDMAKKLLVHSQDMTSTLEKHYHGNIYVERIQKYASEDVYLREVFLRLKETDEIVEYGVIAIVLSSFTADQRRIILADYEPFGGLLHKFEIKFQSAPVCFFEIHADHLKDTPFKNVEGDVFYGRFNKLFKTNDQLLAWILEILPNQAAD